MDLSTLTVAHSSLAVYSNKSFALPCCCVFAFQFFVMAVGTRTEGNRLSLITLLAEMLFFPGPCLGGDEE